MGKSANRVEFNIELLQAMELGEQETPPVVDACVFVSLISTVHVEAFHVREGAYVSCTFVPDRVKT